MENKIGSKLNLKAMINHFHKIGDVKNTFKDVESVPGIPEYDLINKVIKNGKNYKVITKYTIRVNTIFGKKVATEDRFWDLTKKELIKYTK